MKKSYLFGMMAATMFFASSCQNDLDSTSLDTSMVSFNLSTPVIASRAFSDGTMATKLQYAVYNEAGTELTALTKNNESITVGQTKNVELQLTTGNTYSIIFWAANENAPYTVNFADKTMSVNYDNALSNAEVRDAFFARHTFEVKGNQTETIELKRPFAQLNIGTNDYAASASAGYAVTQSSVTVPVYTTLNLFNGEVSGQTEQTFGYAAIPTGETFPVGGYEYLSMNYLLVDADQELVEVEFGYTDGTTPKTRTVGSVPVKRNHRTNIYGQLFTSDVAINVEIVEEYEQPDYNVNLPNPTIVKDNATFEDALASNVEIIQVESGANLNFNGITVQRDVVLDFNNNNVVSGGGTTKNQSISVSGEYDVTVQNANFTGGSIMAYYGANVVLDGVNLTYNYSQSGRNLIYAASDNDQQVVVTIKNGNFTMTGGDGNTYLCAHGNAIINVEGGNFSGKGQGTSNAAFNAIAIGSYVPQIIITGGTFDNDPSGFVPATHEAVKSGSIWTVSAK